MAYAQDDVHDLNSTELGNLTMTMLSEEDVIMVEFRLINNRRHMRTWYADGGTDSDTGLLIGDPIDPEELEDRI